MDFLVLDPEMHLLKHDGVFDIASSGAPTYMEDNSTATSGEDATMSSECKDSSAGKPLSDIPQQQVENKAARWRYWTGNFSQIPNPHFCADTNHNQDNLIALPKSRSSASIYAYKKPTVPACTCRSPSTSDSSRENSNQEYLVVSRCPVCILKQDVSSSIPRSTSHPNFGYIDNFPYEPMRLLKGLERSASPRYDPSVYIARTPAQKAEARKNYLNYRGPEEDAKRFPPTEVKELKSFEAEPKYLPEWRIGSEDRYD